VANLLVVIEVESGHARPVSLETLGQARRLGTMLGATVYTVVPLQSAPAFGDDDLIAVLSRHGADKVMLVTAEALGQTGESMRWGSHGAAIVAASEMLPPSLLLFGATAGAREVAPRAAARLSAAYVPDAWLEVGAAGLLVGCGSGEEARALDGDLDFPVVATVPLGRYTPARGDEEAEVEMVTPAGRAADFEDMGEDGQAPAVVVLADLEDAEVREAGDGLARALGAELRSEGAGVEARWVISLGPGFDDSVSEVRTSLGQPLAGANLVVTGNSAETARAVAGAVTDRREGGG
jgi:electron transfer flavoprotein alpha subunit